MVLARVGNATSSDHLRLIGGLTMAEIARAFLVPEPTLAQRIVRAKRTLTEVHIPFEVSVSAAFNECMAWWR